MSLKTKPSININEFYRAKNEQTGMQAGIKESRYRMNIDVNDILLSLSETEIKVYSEDYPYIRVALLMEYLDRENDSEENITLDIEIEPMNYI